jgi:hypothetical protein
MSWYNIFQLKARNVRRALKEIEKPEQKEL